MSDRDTTPTPGDAFNPNGTSLPELSRLVGGDSAVEVDRPVDFETGNAPEASSRRSARERRSPVRLSDYKLNISAALGIQAANRILDPVSVQRL